MQCDDCGKDIPKHDQRTVYIGTEPFIYPYCLDCAAVYKQQMAAYPKRAGREGRTRLRRKQLTRPK
jgi:hypothetical protein